MRTEQKLTPPGKRSVHHVGGLPTRGTVFSHRNTVGNLHWALRERVLFTTVNGVLRPTLRPTGEFATPGMVAWRRKVLKRLHYSPTPLTHDEFCEKMVGSKKVRYKRASLNLLTGRLRGNSAKVIGFLKPEKYVQGAPPRLISPRSPEYLLETGVYLEPIEKKLYRAVARTEGYECIMKGFNLGDRASVMKSHWDTLKRPAAIGLDASKFDQHVSQAALRYEHGFYTSAYAGDINLSNLLKQQLLNSVCCFCEDGIVSWKSRGGRMSGDMNTALGNCLLSAAMLTEWARIRRVNIKCVVDGDDCVAFLEEGDVDRFLAGLQDWYVHRGFRMKVEAPCYTFEEVEFCQCHPVLINGKWRLVRNPVKAITQDHVWIEKGGISHREVLAATGEGGSALYGDCPVLGSYYRMLRGVGKLSKRSRREMHDEHTWLRHFQGDYVQGAEFDDASRVSFALAFGITPAHQRLLEAYFDSFDLDGALANTLTNKNSISNSSTLLAASAPLYLNFKLI